MRVGLPPHGTLLIQGADVNSPGIRLFDQRRRVDVYFCLGGLSAVVRGLVAVLFLLLVGCTSQEGPSLSEPTSNKNDYRSDYRNSGRPSVLPCIRRAAR